MNRLLFILCAVITIAFAPQTYAVKKCFNDSDCDIGQVCNIGKTGGSGTCQDKMNGVTCADGVITTISGSTTLDGMNSACSSHGGIQSWYYSGMDSATKIIKSGK